MKDPTQDNGRGFRGRIATCMCMAESLLYSPELSTLLIGYTPIQNKKFFFRKLPQPGQNYLELYKILPLALTSLVLLMLPCPACLSELVTAHVYIVSPSSSPSSHCIWTIPPVFLSNRKEGGITHIPWWSVTESWLWHLISRTPWQSCPWFAKWQVRMGHKNGLLSTSSWSVL